MAQLTRRCCVLCCALLVVSCTKGFARSESQHRPHETNDKVAQTAHQVSDRLGRWQSEVVASEVRQSVLPGYTHLEIMFDSNAPMHCFIYEQPIAPGQALSRLLSAIAPGLEIQSYSSPVLSEVNGEVSLSLTVGYMTTMAPVEQGDIALRLHPRTDFPIVCTLDRPQISERAQKVMDEFIAKFSVKVPKYEFESREIWLIYDEQTLRGFRHIQVAKQGDTWLTLTRTSLISFVSKELIASDFVIRESEDDSGLRFAQWAETKNEDVVAQGQIERQVGAQGRGLTYRYALRSHGEPNTGTYDVEQSMTGSYRFLSRDFGRGDSGTLSQFIPQLTAVEPSVCSWQVTTVDTHASHAICYSCEASPVGQNQAKPHTAFARVFQLNEQGEPVVSRAVQSCDAPTGITDHSTIKSEMLQLFRSELMLREGSVVDASTHDQTRTQNQVRD